MNAKVEARKRIVVACDGTWKDSDGEYQIPSNVTRICRCIKREAQDPDTGAIIPQIIYYQSGVGTESTMYNKIVGGSTGQGTGSKRPWQQLQPLTFGTRVGRTYPRSIQLHLQ